MLKVIKIKIVMFIKRSKINIKIEKKFMIKNLGNQVPKDTGIKNY